jgi:carboxymethylenebutenolidase
MKPALSLNHVGSTSVLSLLVGLAFVHLMVAPLRGSDIRESMESFRSGEKTIAVERFQPKADGKHPAILVLHGACGLTAHAKELRATCASLAEKGYATFLIHYFDRTGMKETSDVKEIKRHFLPWLVTIHDAVDYVARQAGVDRGRIGLLGFSLGAYLSLAAGCTKSEITAVVEVNGGLPAVLSGNAGKMPPVLIMHGEADKVVSVEEARSLEKLLKTHERSYEIILFKDQGHVLKGDALANATQRSLAFFSKHLSTVPRRGQRTAAIGEAGAER